MCPAKLLLLSARGADELRSAITTLLSAASQRDFQLAEESIADGQRSTYAQKLEASLEHHQPQVLLFCINSHLREQAAALLEGLRRNGRDTPIVVAASAAEPDELFSILQLGVVDFITAPFRLEEILPRLQRLYAHTHQGDPEVRNLKEKLGLSQFVGESPAFISVVQKIASVARCDVNVLLCGETGTGKEIFARAIHYLSPRSDKPFIPLNSGALPVDLIENELFGHELGAFTGATSAAAGLLVEAEGGTLFLDEVDCLPPPAQVKLLRFLQDKEFRPLGSRRTRKADVRITVATNANLAQAVRAGRFRQDLYYRLNVISLSLPPLRERKEDIPLLARRFIAKYSAEFDRPANALTPAALRRLVLYDWPGNVRELENVIQRAVIFCDRLQLQPGDISLPAPVSSSEEGSFQSLKSKVVQQFESKYIHDLLLAHDGNISQAARAAKKNRRAFWELMRKHHIEPSRIPFRNESSQGQLPASGRMNLS